MSPQDQALVDVQEIAQEEGIDLSGTVDYSSSIDVANRILAIQRIEDKIDTLRAQRDDAVAFYAKRMAQLEERIAFFKGEILGFLDHNRSKNIATHHGTASIVRRESVVYGKDKAKLMEWIMDKAIPDGIKTETSQSINMPVLKQYVESTGDTPPEYSKEIRETVQIRRVGP